VPVTWFVSPRRPRAELVLLDPYTSTEWEEAIFAILNTSTLSESLRLLIDRRGARRPTANFVGCMLSFLRTHEARLAGTRAAVLVNESVPEALPALRVGRFRMRTFRDAAKAVQWLDPDWDAPGEREAGKT
jgi:hypothetical protein